MFFFRGRDKNSANAGTKSIRDLRTPLRARTDGDFYSSCSSYKLQGKALFKKLNYEYSTKDHVV